MKISVIATVLAAALAAGATAGLMPRPMPLYDHTPARAHAVLGPVTTLSDQRPKGASWSAQHAAALTADAKARYGRRPDALIALAHEPFPDGVGARSTALAVTWLRGKDAD